MHTKPLAPVASLDFDACDDSAAQVHVVVGLLNDDYEAFLDDFDEFRRLVTAPWPVRIGGAL